MSRQISSLLAAALALSLTACGTPEDGNPVVRSEREIPKRQLVDQADDICRRSRAAVAKRLAGVAAAPDLPADIRAVAPSLDVRAQAARREVDQIAALGSPSTGVDSLDDYLDQRLTNANAYRSAAKAVRKGDTSDFEGYMEQVNPARALMLAKRFGFKVCD